MLTATRCGGRLMEELKTCKKGLHQYVPKGNNKQGCPRCNYLRVKAWEEKNHQKAKSRKRKDYVLNKVKYLERMRNYRAQNSNDIKASRKLHYQQNVNLYKSQNRQYYVKNQELIKTKTKHYAAENVENIKNYKIQYRRIYEVKIKKSQKQWRSLNLHLVNKYSSERRARKRKATLQGLTQDHHIEIESNYVCAQIMKAYTGYDWHVDHIIPLQGKDVCGLHVPWNLQVIPAKENLRKSNKLH